MAQHFRLSATARQLSVDSLVSLSDDEIFQLLKQARWDNVDGMNDVICPHCHTRHHAYFISTRKQWQCKHCQHRFLLQQALFFKVQNFLCVKLYWQFSIFRLKAKDYLLLRYHTSSTCNIKQRGYCCINFVNRLIKPKI